MPTIDTKWREQLLNNVQSGNEDYELKLILTMCDGIEYLSVPTGLWLSRTGAIWCCDFGERHPSKLKYIQTHDYGDKDACYYDSFRKLLQFPTVEAFYADLLSISAAFDEFESHKASAVKGAVLTQACFHDGKAFDLFLQTCPALQSLSIEEADGRRSSYESHDYNLTFPLIGTALRAFATQLEVLHLAFSDFSPRPYMHKTIIGTIGSLRVLDRLTKLKLLDIALIGEEEEGDGWRSRDEDSDDDTEKPPVTAWPLDVILPLSLRSLSIVRWAENVENYGEEFRPGLLAKQHRRASTLEILLESFLLHADEHQNLSMIELKDTLAANTRFDGLEWSVTVESSPSASKTMTLSRK